MTYYVRAYDYPGEKIVPTKGKTDAVKQPLVQVERTRPVVFIRRVPEARRISCKTFLVREVGRHLPRSSVTVKGMKQCHGLYLSDTLHKTVAEGRAIRSIEREHLQRTR